ncbi:MAG: ComF family protein [Verrucomicrobiia bacterium]
MSDGIPTTARPRVVQLWARRVLDLVWPRNCPFCGCPLADTDPGIVCPACVSSAKLIEPPFCRQCALPFPGTVTDDTFVCGYCQGKRFHFSRTVCACRAQGVVRDCILRFKYNREMYFGRHLVDWLSGAAQRWIDWREVDGIVPVPLHPRKQRQREFNQAEYLAAGVSRAFAVPVLNGKVRRVKDTGTQTKLDAEARARNLRGAFAVRDDKVFAGKRLVLLDDVFTTGATMDSCAKTLRGVGAKDVIALAVARGV